MFPAVLELLKLQIVPWVLFTIAASILGVCFWLWRPKLGKIPTGVFAGLGVLLVGIALFSFATCLTHGIWFGQVFNSESVEAVVIRRIEFEGAPPSEESIQITNQQDVRELVESLLKSPARFRNHETYSNGYLVEFVLRESELSLFVLAFHHSDKYEEGDIVIPAFHGYEGTSSAGEYTNARFVRLVSEAMQSKGL